MKKSDVAPAVSALMNHPLFRAQYEADPVALAKAWRALEGLDAFHALVFEEIETSGARVLGPGVRVAVTDAFALEMKSQPFFWLGPEIAKRVSAGRSPILTNDQLREANATTGVNIVAWPSSPPPADSQRMEVNHLYMGAFMEVVRGYKIRELFFQTPVGMEVMAVLQWGACLVTREGTFTSATPDVVERTVKDPYVLVMNAEMAASRFGSWASDLFIDRTPQLGLARSEQRLIEAAIGGATDEEVAKELEISESAVKKAWRSVYERVERCRLGIFGTDATDFVENGDRGKGKKHRVLTYVREHPEELRPVSMRLLKLAQTQRRAPSR